MHSHTDGPTEAHRSWLWFQTACPFVASTPPRNDRSWPASALEPATARVASSQPRLRASSSVPPGNAPSSGLSGAAESSVHAVPHTVLGARSPHKRSAPWLALPCPPAEESSKSWSALSHSHSHSHGGSEPQPDRTLPRVGSANVPARCSSPLEASSKSKFSASQLATFGTGTIWFRRKYPPSPSTPPFSCPSAGVQNSDSNPQCDRKAMNRVVSSRWCPRRIFFTALFRLS